MAKATTLIAHLRVTVLQPVPLKLLLFGGVALASTALGFLVFDAAQSRRLVERYGYYTISLTFAWALFSIWRVKGAALGELVGISRRQKWEIVSVVLGCTLVAAFTVPIDYKVFYDEFVVQATASNLHFFREVSTIVRGYTVDGVFVPFTSYLDKRPFFYAYLVSLVHDITGYRVANGFAINLVLLPVVLAQLYLIGRRCAGHAATLAGVISLGTVSALAHSATGAGMEMLNLAMLLLVIQLSVLYLDVPGEERLAALVLAAVLLAQTRYESSLYVGPVAFVALEGWRRAGRVILPVGGIVAPALLIPYAIHNTYLSGTPLLWELHDDAQTRFGWEYVLPNIGHAGKFFFGLSGLATNSLWLSAAGFAALAFVVGTWWRSRSSWRTATSAAVVWLSFGAAITANLFLLMFYYWGQLDDPIVARLSLPFYALLTMAVIFTVDRLSTPRHRLARIMAGGAVLGCLCTGLIANAQHTRLNVLADELNWEQRFVDGREPGERLIITGKSALPWMLRRTSAIAIYLARAQTDALRFHLSQHTFREVLVFQLYRPGGPEGNYQLDPASRLPEGFVLEPIAERRFGPRLDRVSRLIQIRADPAVSVRK